MEIYGYGTKAVRRVGCRENGSAVCRLGPDGAAAQSVAHNGVSSSALALMVHNNDCLSMYEQIEMMQFAVEWFDRLRKECGLSLIGHND